MVVLVCCLCMCGTALLCYLSWVIFSVAIIVNWVLLYLEKRTLVLSWRNGVDWWVMRIACGAEPVQYVVEDNMEQ